MRAIFAFAGMSQPVSPKEEEGLFSLSHEVLFEEVDVPCCDACGRPSLPEDDRRGYAVPGSAIYLWTRGGEVRFEKAPLCSSCASAIGMTALARWEIEEEEG